MWKRKREHRERSRSWASTPSMCLHIWWALLQGPCAPGASKLCLCKCADALTLLLLFLSYPLLFLLALLPLLASLSFCLLILCLAPPFLAFPLLPLLPPPLLLSFWASCSARRQCANAPWHILQLRVTMRPGFMQWPHSDLPQHRCTEALCCTRACLRWGWRRWVQV